MTEEGAEEQSIKSSQPKTTEREKRQRHRSGQSEKSKQTLFSYSTSKTEKTPIPSINGSQGVEKLKKQRNPHWDPAWLPDISNIKSTDQRKRFPGGYVRLAPLFIQSSSINTGQSRALRVLNKDCAKVFQNIVPALDPSKIAAALHPKRFFSGSIRQSRIVGAHRKKYNNYNSFSAPVSSVLRKQSKREELCSESSLKQDFGERRPDVVQLYQKEVLQCCRKTPSFLKYWNQHCKFNSYNLTSKTSRLSVICLPYSNEEASKSNSSPNTSTSVLSVCSILSGDQNQQSSNTNKGLTATDLSNLPIDFNKNSIEYTEGAVSIPSRVKKSFTKDTRKLIASIRKAMNSKTKSQIASKKTRGMLQHQQAPRRGRPHGGSNISASFILPYGLEKEIQQSTANVVPSSSSFHGGPLESLQLMSENHQRTVRQQSMSTNGQRLQRKFLDRQKYKMLKPLTTNKNQNNFPKFYEMSASDFSAAILPDSSTTYRFAHDVSFDEGSRYRTTDLHNSFKGNLPDHGLNGLSRQLSSSLAMRNHENGLHDLRISNRDHLSNANHITSKDATPSSINRVEDKCDLPPTLSSTSPSMPPAIAASTSNASFIPPPSASRQNAQSSTSAPSSNITFRLHKEKQNWSNRLGELTINGGGYSNSLPGPNTSKTDMEPLLRMNMTSAVQRNLQTRERAMATAPKSRISSRYSSKNGSACSDPNYADPCIAAQPSYQQRLMDLSMLESETVKYERNRKLKRKKNQDKDS